MPEMFADPEFWVAVAFVVVVVGLVWKGGPMITKMLDDRADKIEVSSTRRSACARRRSARSRTTSASSAMP